MNIRGGEHPERCFHRSLVQEGDRWLVRSECVYCGKVIVGSVSEGLFRDEAEHAKNCSKRFFGRGVS